MSETGLVTEPLAEPRPPRPRLAGPTLASVIVVGLLGDLAIRSGVTTLAMAVLVAVTSGVLLASGRLVNPQARWLVAAAPLFGTWAAIRTSPWLVPLDLTVAFCLLALGASMARGGSLFDLWFFDLGRRGLAACGLLARGPALLGPHVRPMGGVAVVRGVIIALPIVGLLGALLASADAVFASFFRIRMDATSGVGHILLIALTVWVLLGLLLIASTRTSDRPAIGPALRLGPVEVTVILSSVIALFGAFAVARIAAEFGAADHVLKTEGLTYAEYARSGFFQLLWVCGITIVGLVSLRAAADLPRLHDRRRFVVLAEVVLLLAVGIVGTAISRLSLYNHAYGLTMLRLFCIVFAVSLGVVMVLLGGWLAGVGRGQCWFPAAALGVGLVVLLALNAVNPEAVVVRSNLTRQRLAPVDAGYIGTLSDDAVSTAIALLPTLDPALQAEVLAAIGCPPDGRESWADTNVGAARARDARKPFCTA